MIKQYLEKMKKKSYYNGYLQGVVDIFNIMLTTYSKEDEDEPQHIVHFHTKKINEIVISLQDRIEHTWEDGYLFYNEKTNSFDYSER